MQRVAESLTPLAGAFLKEVYQPTVTELVLELRADRDTRLLLLSAHPRLSRLHPINHRPPNPRTPFTFQMLCRKELSGRLESLEPSETDRLIRLTFQGAHRRVLVAELTGRHANVLLLDEEENVLGSLIPTHRDTRRLASSGPYAPPPPPPQSHRTTDRFALHLGSPFYLQAVESFFQAEAERLAREDLRAQLLTSIRREKKRLDHRLEELAGDLEKAEKAEKHRRYGDLLQIHLRDIPKGRGHVTVADVFREEPDRWIEVPLDPQLDALGNVQRHYRLYRKYDASIPMVLERTEQTEREVKRLSDLEAAAAKVATLEALEGLEQQALIPKRTQRPGARHGQTLEREPFIRYVTSRGAEIWVGRSAQDNDQLTFRLARGNDFWCHVRGRPGAHVLIPVRGSSPPDLEVLLDAACLALKFSGFSWGDKGEVAYTRVKHVRRIPGAHPGLVTYSQDKTLFVELSKSRFDRFSRRE